MCEVDQLANRLDNPLAFLPIVLWHVSPNHLTFGFSFKDQIGIVPASKVDANCIISGLGLMDLVRLAVSDGRRDDDRYTLDVTPELIGEPLYLELDHSRPPLNSASIEFSLSGGIQFGFAKDLPAAVTKSQIEDEVTELFFKLGDLRDKIPNFVNYQGFDDLPQNAKEFHLRAISVPDKVIDIGRYRIQGRRKDDNEWETITQSETKPDNGKQK